MYHIPVALTPPDGKTALALCENTLMGLKRYGITSEDLWRAVNDNCDVAKMTGRLTVGVAIKQKRMVNVTCIWLPLLLVLLFL